MFKLNRNRVDIPIVDMVSNPICRSQLFSPCLTMIESMCFVWSDQVSIKTNQLFHLSFISNVVRLQMALKAVNESENDTEASEDDGDDTITLNITSAPLTTYDSTPTPSKKDESDEKKNISTTPESDKQHGKRKKSGQMPIVVPNSPSSTSPPPGISGASTGSKTVKIVGSPITFDDIDDDGSGEDESSDINTANVSQMFMQ